MHTDPDQLYSIPGFLEVSSRFMIITISVGDVIMQMSCERIDCVPDLLFGMQSCDKETQTCGPLLHSRVDHWWYVDTLLEQEMR